MVCIVTLKSKIWVLARWDGGGGRRKAKYPPEIIDVCRHPVLVVRPEKIIQTPKYYPVQKFIARPVSLKSRMKIT